MRLYIPFRPFASPSLGISAPLQSSYSRIYNEHLYDKSDSHWFPLTGEILRTYMYNLTQLGSDLLRASHPKTCVALEWEGTPLAPTPPVLTVLSYLPSLKHQTVFHSPSIVYTCFFFCLKCFSSETLLIYLTNTSWFFRSQLGSHSLLSLPRTPESGLG